MTAQLSKTDFINAIRANDRDGYENIYQQYGGILYGIILNNVVDESMAAQLFTETMVDSWKRIDEFESSRIDLLQWMILRVLRPKLACYKTTEQSTNTGIGNGQL